MLLNTRCHKWSRYYSQNPESPFFSPNVSKYNIVQFPTFFVDNQVWFWSHFFQIVYLLKICPHISWALRICDIFWDRNQSWLSVIKVEKMFAEGGREDGRGSWAFVTPSVVKITLDYRSTKSKGEKEGAFWTFVATFGIKITIYFISHKKRKKYSGGGELEHLNMTLFGFKIPQKSQKSARYLRRV